MLKTGVVEVFEVRILKKFLSIDGLAIITRQSVSGSIGILGIS